MESDCIRKLAFSLIDGPQTPICLDAKLLFSAGDWQFWNIKMIKMVAIDVIYLKVLTFILKIVVFLMYLFRRSYQGTPARLRCNLY